MPKNTETRRDFFSRFSDGLHGAALAWLLGGDLFSSNPALANSALPTVYDLKPKIPHISPKAKAVIQLFMNGGPSQVDLLDPKPALERFSGQSPGRDLASQIRAVREAGGLMPSPFRFAKHGQAGTVILLGHRAPKRVEGAGAANRHARAGCQTPGRRQADPDPDERPRPTADGNRPHLPPATASLGRALHLGEQGSGVPRASVGRQAECGLVQNLAAADRADSGVGGRRVETDDHLLLGAQLSQ